MCIFNLRRLEVLQVTGVPYIFFKLIKYCPAKTAISVIRSRKSLTGIMQTRSAFKGKEILRNVIRNFLAIVNQT
jgi:hypothetical protein